MADGLTHHNEEDRWCRYCKCEPAAGLEGTRQLGSAQGRDEGRLAHASNAVAQVAKVKDAQENQTTNLIASRGAAHAGFDSVRFGLQVGQK